MQKAHWRDSQGAHRARPLYQPVHRSCSYLSGQPSLPPDGEPVAPREERSLTTLEVGNTPIRDDSALTVALALLHVSPHISGIGHINPQ